jgi:hypothetical protein
MTGSAWFEVLQEIGGVAGGDGAHASGLIVPKAQVQITPATERWRAPGRDLATKATEVLPMKSNKGASDGCHINLKLPGQRRRSRARRCRRGRILLTDRKLRAMPIVSVVSRGSVIPAALTDRPLPAVRIDVTTPVRPADGRGVHVDRGDRHGAKRERQRDQILRNIFHRFLLHLRQKNLV